MNKKNNYPLSFRINVKWQIAIIVLVFIGVSIVGIGGYERGYNEGIKELSEYKQENYIYYNGWHKFNEDAFSEHIYYKNSSYSAFRGGENYYSLDFSNPLSNAWFEINYNIERGTGGLRVINSTCVFDRVDGVNLSASECGKDYFFVEDVSRGQHNE